MFLKTYRKDLLIDSVLMLLPIALGYILPNTKEEPLRTIWQFVLPLLSLLIFWLIIWIGKKKGFGIDKPQTIRWLLFLKPLLTLSICSMLIGLEYFPDWNGEVIVNGITALIFIGIGNILPKISQNEMIGIRTRCALENKENWNYSQRVGGRIWVACGIVMLGASFFPFGIGVTIVLALLASVLTIYISWRYAQKQKEKGVVFRDPGSFDRKQLWWILLLVPIFLIVLAVIMLWNYTIDVGERTIHFDANLVSDTVIPYDEIESVEFAPNLSPGKRVNGYDARNTLMGTFENIPYGRYSRYTKSNGDVLVIQTKENGIVVCNEETESQTKALLHKIKSHLSK